MTDIQKENKSGGKVPNLRFPNFEGEWKVKKLGEVCEIKTGNKDTQNKVENGKYPFFVRSNTVEKRKRSSNEYCLYSPSNSGNLKRGKFTLPLFGTKVGTYKF